MGKLVGARVYNSGNISINTATATALTFDSERYDHDTIHSTSSNTGRLTCNTSGIYLITGAVVWDNVSSGTYRQVSIMINGTTYIAGTRTNTGSFGTCVQSVATLYYLSASDYAELIVVHDRGSALNVVASANNSPEFAMHRVG